LLDVQVSTLANQGLNYLATGNNPKRQGNAHPNIVPYQTFNTSDGIIMLAIGNDTQFRKFCQLVERPELADNPNFQTNEQRVINRESLIEHLSKIPSITADSLVDQSIGNIGYPLRTYQHFAGSL